MDFWLSLFLSWFSIFQASSSQHYIVALPGLKGHFSGLVGQYRTDGITETLRLQKFDSAATLSDFIASNLHFFTGQDNSALIAFLASLVLSRGIRTIKGKKIDGGTSALNPLRKTRLKKLQLVCANKLINLTKNRPKIRTKTKAQNQHKKWLLEPRCVPCARVKEPFLYSTYRLFSGCRKYFTLKAPFSLL